MKKIVFSDVDGTLLTSDHRVSQNNRLAIISLKKSDVPFVIVSARSPAAISTITDEIAIDGGFGPIVAFSGALICQGDEILVSKGMKKSLCSEIIDFIEESGFKTAWCIYSFNQWIVRDKADPRIVREADIVKVAAVDGTADSVASDVVHKIMCIDYDPAETDKLEIALREKFTCCSVVKSCATQLEIMQHGVNKGDAVQSLCEIFGVDVEDSIAFGDNYNDVRMLESAGVGYIMENAPEELKKLGFVSAKTNNNDGVFYALKELNLI